MNHDAEHLHRGKQAEDLALRYLEQQGLKLIGRNFACPRGEIDLIMQHRDSLVFVEVRYRKNSSYGQPAETVTRSKMQRILRTAETWLARHPRDTAVRFDIVGITPGQPQNHIQWIQDAFQATD